MNYWKLGCRWYSKAPLFYDYLYKNKIVISWTGMEFQIGDVVLLTDGFTSLGLAIVKSKSKSLNNYTEYIDNFKKLEIPTTDKNLLVFEAEFFPINDAEKFDYKLQGGIRQIQKQSIKKLISKIMSDNVESKNIEENIELLKYKKQIILQGPPGTGKTRLAKQIAIKLTGFGNISDVDINNFIKVGSNIQSVKGSAQYVVEDKVGRKITLKRSNGSLGETSFDKIIQYYEEKKWNEEITDNEKRRAAAIAKFIFDKKFSNDENQIKLVQFHPSYTYEDFVRGIVAESKEKNIEYKNVNKTLGLFAKEALLNFKASTDDSPKANIEAWIDEKFEIFKNEIGAKLPEKELILSGDITIFDVTDSHFKYAENWKTPGYLKYVEFKKLIKAVLQDELSLSNRQLDKEKFIHAHYRYTYYNALLKLFFDEYSYDKETVKEKAKIYILIIDEINRANLSSVLGELIYALEYRGEEVESMYEVDGSQKLILPPNLYIIGTLNTADRSVGHIDYAIRRRFAFVDVLPEELNDEKIVFQKELFKKVSALFINNYEAYIADKNTKLERAKTLAAEFRPEDVWLGHSYFIQTKEKDKDGKDILVPEDFNIRLEYEIKPILMEYVKDGILINTIKDGESEIKVEDYIKAL